MLAAMVLRDFHVLIPFGEGQPYDLVIDLGDAHFLRIQCKTAWPQRGCLVFNPHMTDHGRGRRPYTGLADIFGVYFPPAGSVYLVPLDAVASYSGRLRLEPTRNNQRQGVRYAADYEIDRWTAGALREIVRVGARADEAALTLA